MLSIGVCIVGVPLQIFEVLQMFVRGGEQVLLATKMVGSRSLEVSFDDTFCEEVVVGIDFFDDLVRDAVFPAMHVVVAVFRPLPHDAGRTQEDGDRFDQLGFLLADAAHAVLPAGVVHDARHHGRVLRKSFGDDDDGHVEVMFLVGAGEGHFGKCGHDASFRCECTLCLDRLWLSL